MNKFFRRPNFSDLNNNVDKEIFVNNYFKKTTLDDLENSNVEKLNEMRSLLIKLKENTNDALNIDVLKKFIIAKKNNEELNGEIFLYSLDKGKNLINYEIEEFRDVVSNILKSDIDVSGGIKSNINGFDAQYNYDYRITLSNSNKLIDEDIISFVNDFNEQTKKYNISYGIKVIPNERDVVIIYLKSSDLQKIIEILQNIKQSNPIISKFGNVKPFTTTYEKDSYYSISMGSTKDVKVTGIKGTWSERIKMGRTMTEYTANLIDQAYVNLYQKYGDVELISPEEMYVEMKKLHNIHYDFNKNEDVPIWMNEEINNEFHKHSI